MKTKEELNALKEEVETVSKKLRELTEDELAQVSGGRLARNLFGKPCHTPGSFSSVVIELLADAMEHPERPINE